MSGDYTALEAIVAAAEDAQDIDVYAEPILRYAQDVSTQIE